MPALPTYIRIDEARLRLYPLMVREVTYDRNVRDLTDLEVTHPDGSTQTIMSWQGCFRLSEVDNVRAGRHKYAGESFAGCAWSIDAPPSDRGRPR